MDEERYQKELFEFEEPKKPFSKLSTMLPKPDFEGKVAIILTLDKMVFISLGIVMIMVLVFALGVETGKGRAAARALVAGPPQDIAQRAVSAQPAARSPASGAVPVAPAMARQNPAPSQKAFLNTSPAAVAARPAGDPAAIQKQEPLQDATKPYTIVAAAFNRKDTAQSGAELLKRDGFRAYIYFSSPYYLVCVGRYDDKNGSQVQRDLRVVKRTYKDAYVKQR